MRVVGGAVKGKKLRGAASRGVRPTTELVRGAIFNILGEDEVRGAKVLELFAGTGALGIEALSRGAAWVDFVERDPKQCAVIKENLSSTGFSDKARVLRMSVNSALESLKGPYELILMDPPYELESLTQVLDGLERSSLPGDRAVLVVGHSKRQTLEGSYGGFIRTGSHRYGDSQVALFSRGH